MGPFSPLSASTFVQPFFRPTAFCQTKTGQSQNRTHLCAGLARFIFPWESLPAAAGGDGGGGDGKKPGIVASTRTRSLPLVPPTLKSRTHDRFTVRALYPASLNYNAEEK